MCARKKRPLFSALQMKLLSAMSVIAVFTTQTSWPASTSASVFSTPLSKTPLSVISARRGADFCFVNKTELFFAENATFRFTKPMSTHRSTTGLFFQALSSQLLLLYIQPHPPHALASLKWPIPLMQEPPSLLQRYPKQFLMRP